MKLIEWLRRTVATETGPAPTIAALAPAVPSIDSPETLPPEMIAEQDGAILLEDIFTAIEYTDANGEVSRRRITMRCLEPGPHAPLLLAICHERRAVRRFRTDRIDCFIDQNGEIIEPDDYWRDIGINLARIAPRPGALGRVLINRFRPALSILVTLSRADGVMHPAEIDAILAYVADEALEVGVECTGGALEELRVLIMQMRPQQTSIENYYLATLTYRDSRCRRFARAVKEVILADGNIDTRETSMAEQLEGWAIEENERIRQELAADDAVVIRLELDQALIERLARINRAE